MYIATFTTHIATSPIGHALEALRTDTAANALLTERGSRHVAEWQIWNESAGNVAARAANWDPWGDVINRNAQAVRAPAV
ncbi:MAG: hypothetical protein AAGD38_20035 [Acidobacteriota bacterium]